MESMMSDAFTRLVDEHYAGLYRFALSLSRNSSDAADLTQQVFYVWATKGHALRDGAKAKSWLFTTLYREFLRGRRRGHRITPIEDQPLAVQDPPDESISSVRRLEGLEVMQALQSVDEDFRAPLTLFYLEDLSYREIAETLAVPLGTVMSRLSRGKSQLRAVLAGLGQDRDGKTIPFSSDKEGTGS